MIRGVWLEQQPSRFCTLRSCCKRNVSLQAQRTIQTASGMSPLRSPTTRCGAFRLQVNHAARLATFSRPVSWARSLEYPRRGMQLFSPQRVPQSILGVPREAQPFLYGVCARKPAKGDTSSILGVPTPTTEKTRESPAECPWSLREFRVESRDRSLRRSIRGPWLLVYKRAARWLPHQANRSKSFSSCGLLRGWVLQGYSSGILCLGGYSAGLRPLLRGRRTPKTQLLCHPVCGFWPDFDLG